MNKENIKIEIYTEKGYIKVECADGHYITDWDKKDILEFTDSKIMYCPLNYNLDAYYCLTDEEHNAYVAEQIAKIKEMENNQE